MFFSFRFTSRRAVRLLVAAALTAVVLPGELTAQQPPRPDQMAANFPKMPEGFAAKFDLRDNRALDMMQYMHCMNNTVAAAQDGILGAIPDGALVVCVREKDEWRGVFGMLDKDRANFRIVAQLALRGLTGVRTTAAVDTMRASAAVRAMLRGHEAVTLRNKGRYEFTPVPLQLGTFVEVWFMPVQNNASKLLVGGDSLIQMTADGRREQGHFSKAAPVREVPMPTGAAFVLQSTEDEIPLVSELMAARLALLRVPEVRIVTKRYTSVLSNATRKWKHTARTG